MPRFRITVVKKFGPEDVLGHKHIRPSGKEVVKCSSFEEGDSFISEDGNIPEGFCRHAWNALYTTIELFSFGGNYPDWEPGSAYVACPDGIRPVCFKLERIEEE